MSDNQQKTPGKLTVPGSSHSHEWTEPEEEFEGLVSPEDLGSASRSCLAILIVLLIIAALICIFLIGTIFFR